MSIPEPLADTVRLFKGQWPLLPQCRGNVCDHQLGSSHAGQHIVPQHYHPAVDLIADQEIAGLIDSVRTVIAACVDAMPTHAQFIARHCAAAPA